MEDIVSCLSTLCEEHFGKLPVRAEKLPLAGGDRRYYRLVMPKGFMPASILGVQADSEADARAFIALSACFLKHGCNVPQVYAHSPSFNIYLVEDMGRVSLFDKVTDKNFPDKDKEMAVKETLNQLIRMQTVPVSDWKASVAYKPFSKRQVLWDLNYFKYEYLKNTPILFDEELLEDDFESVAGRLMALSERLNGFMMRDCQSRNVMLRNADNASTQTDEEPEVPANGYEPYFIDFQGGRKGPMLYDAISFLWQAKAGFSSGFRKEMLCYYARQLSSRCNIPVEDILGGVGEFALFRTLQVLGAYGFRGLVQKRAHFIESIPAALRNLAELMDEGVLDPYPELKKIAGSMMLDERFLSGRDKDGRLHIHVFSFSYKRGYPEDFSGNGGGFMFDCRGMHNPGRYDEYKQLTGLDKPVIDFLEERGEVGDFVAGALDVVKSSVKTYIRRGFSSLQIGFGCTGGRHRSVYCAEAMTRSLAAEFPEAVVHLLHREQSISKIFNQ